MTMARATIMRTFYSAPPTHISKRECAFHHSQQSTYVFGQDEWHLSKNLVLTLGLRYEYNTPKADTQGRTFSVIPGLQSTRFPFAPRDWYFPAIRALPQEPISRQEELRAALRICLGPTGSGKTSLRGGGGIFYDILKGEDNLQFNGQPRSWAPRTLLQRCWAESGWARRIDE